MIIDVLIWDITANYSGSWDVDGGGSATINSGQTIVVKLDDTTHSLSAWQNGTNKLLNGPNLFFGFGGSATLRTIAPFYQYCQETTLRQVGTNNSFPYGTLGSNANNSECQVAPTCDLEISNDYTITPATGPATADGSIVGSATSSNGVVKFSFDPNFEYGDPFTLYPLEPLTDWVSFNTSSEPMVWTTGAAPTLTVTPPTTLTPAQSDWFGPPYIAGRFVEGVMYNYAFQFTVYASSSLYHLIRVVVGDVFFNVLKEKVVAGYATPTGTVITGTFQFVAPAEVGGSPLRLALYVEYLGGVPSSFSDVEVVVNSFTDMSGTPADPGVQEELNFAGLLPGNYTVYAKDAVGCQDSISFEIPVTTSYGVRYRLEYRDLLRGTSYKFHRLDIKQRSYVGPIEEIKGGRKPVKIRYEGDKEDPNVALVASNATIELLVETSGQFNDMFLSDDRKYMVEHYIGDDEASIELYWTGYIVPEFHSEPYIFEPYHLTITASDGIGELKNKDFTDLNDNNFRGDHKAIKLISEILKKTGLELDIHCGINVFDENMDEDGDPLDQAYIDSRIYYNKRVPQKCDYVLKSIMDPFRGQMFQSKGVWWIIRLSDAVGTFPYRQFNFNGELESDSSINTVFELDFPSAIHPLGKAMFANKTQLLTFVRNYGYFEITHDLKKDGNLIDTGAFESEDIIQMASGNYTFQDWNVLIGQPGVKYGHETVVNGDSTGAFYFDFSSAVGNQIDTKLYSTEIPLQSTNGRIGFKFQYFATPEYNVPYVRIAWTLKFRMADDTYRWLTYATNGAITYDFVEQKNDIYVTQYESWQTFDLLTEIPTAINTSEAVEIAFYLHDHAGRDFDSITDLKAFVPSTLSNPNGAKRMVAGDFGETNIYTAEYSHDAEDLPVVVRPDSYDAGSGDFRWLWRLDKIINVASTTALVRRVKFDNVSLAFYPKVFQPTTAIITPPEVLTYAEETDPLVIPDFTKTVILGDMIRFDDTLLMNENNLYRGYFRLEDGTPTRNWHRLGVDESKRLLQITLEDYRDQFRLPQRRLSGLKITTNTLHFINCLRDNVDGTRYRPMTFEFDTVNAMYTPDMAGVLAGSGGEPPLVTGEFNEPEFTDDYNTGE
jgi:hypothetical protein